MVAVATGRLPATRAGGAAVWGPRARPCGCRGNAAPGMDPGPAAVSGIAPRAGDSPAPWIFLWKSGSAEAAGSRGGTARLFRAVLGYTAPGTARGSAPTTVLCRRTEK